MANIVGMFCWEPYISQSYVLNCRVPHFKPWTNRPLEVSQILASYFYMSSTFPLLIMFKPYIEEKMTSQVLSIMEKYKEPISNIMKVANITFSGDDGKIKSSNRMGLNLQEALFQHGKCIVRNLVLNGCIEISNAIYIFDTCQYRGLMR